MTLQAHRHLPLDFESLVEEPDEIRWAVDKARQKQREWCWAASLANVLAAYGRESDQANLARDFRGRFGDATNAQGTNLARQLWLPFYRKYFPAADLLEGALSERELRERLARSPIIGVLHSTQGSHLIVIAGLRTREGRAHVAVSDSLRPGVSWLPYQDLRAGGGAAHWGPWRETVTLGRPGFGSYSSRFASSVTELRIPELAPLGRLLTTTVSSQLVFEPCPKPFRLREELSLSLLGYLLHYKQIPAQAIDERPYLHESIPLSRLPRGFSTDTHLAPQAIRIGWHHQLVINSVPRQYAQSRRVRGDWRTRWIGDPWLTESVDRAIQWLDRNAGDRSGPVVMIWVPLRRLQHLHFLRVARGDLYLVASASWPEGRDIWLPGGEFELLADEEVRVRLRET